jgi:preprotein translocase subunit SecE
MKIRNILEKIKNFFKEVATEARKVNWPTRQETLRYTLIVITISFSIAFFLGFLDFLYQSILKALIT